MEKSEQIWMDFEKKLKLFILSRIPDEAVADDILQEVFISVHLKIDSLNDKTKISSWIYRITHNLIVDHFRIGISYTAAKTRAFRARKLLKDMLMNCCHYQFDKYGTVLEITPHHCCCCHPGIR